MSDEEIPGGNAREFYEITKDQPPSPVLVTALELFNFKEKGIALDLGCGAGKDTRYLLEKGFEVTAVDSAKQTAKIMAHLPHQERLHYIQTSFEDFTPQKYDIVNAQWSLPFNSPETFPAVFEKIKKSINEDGIFAGQLFGVNDEWNTPDTTMTFKTKKEAEELFKDMEVVLFKEQDQDSTLPNGTPKHWHVFHIIAKKPAISRK